MKIDARSWGFRAGLVAAVATGLTLAAARSTIITLTPAIPWRIFPDVRLALLFAITAVLGAMASGGGGTRRAQLLFFAVLAAIVFHVETVTIHWITDAPGSVTGARLDLWQLSGTLGAFAAIALLHVEVESTRFGRDAVARGADEARSNAAAGILRAQGSREIGLLAAGALALALLVLGAERVIGERTLGAPPVALAIGGAVLLAGLVWGYLATRTRA